MTRDGVLEALSDKLFHLKIIHPKQIQREIGVELFNPIAEDKKNSQDSAESCELVHDCVESSRIELKS